MCNIECEPTLEPLFLRISPDRFHYLKFVIEAYDNLAILSSVDNREGIVVLRYSHGHRTELFALVTSIAGGLV